jgi:hypothetical protein
METKQLASVGVEYHALRGLLLVPVGVVFIGAGLFNLPIGDEPVSGDAWYFAGLLALAVVGWLLINNYYVTRFGRVDPSRATKAKTGVYTAVAAIAICGGITIDSQFHLPISVYGLCYATSMLAYYQLMVGLRRHHWAFLGGLAILCALPVWGRIDDTVSMTLIPMGVATIGIGLYDHSELVRSFRRLRSTTMPGGADDHLA